MATVRIIITLKPGVLDAQGQVVLQGLRALGYKDVSEVRVGRYVEVTVPDELSPEEIHQMCDRFLANPLIEQWKLVPDDVRTPGSGLRASSPRQSEARGPMPEARRIIRRMH